MKVTIIESGELRELRYMANNQNQAMDIMGAWGAIECGNISWNPEESRWDMVQVEFTWWQDKLKELQELDERIAHLKEIHGDLIDDVVQKASIEGDLEMHIESVNQALDEL